MDLIWFKWIAVIALAISVGLICWNIVLAVAARKTPSDEKSARFWEETRKGPFHIPQHEPDQIPQDASEDARRFFIDFAPFADWMNEHGRHWRFENTGHCTTWSKYAASRDLRLWYHNLYVGDLNVSCTHYVANGKRGDINILLRIDYARMFRHLEIVELVGDMIYNLSGELEKPHEERNESVEGHLKVQRAVFGKLDDAMIDNMWLINGQIDRRARPLRMEISGRCGRYFDHLKKELSA